MSRAGNINLGGKPVTQGLRVTITVLDSVTQQMVYFYYTVCNI